MDPILLVDLGGNDVYQNRAGGADPVGIEALRGGDGVALRVVADLAGNDAYEYRGPPAVTQGAGALGGLGILVDAAGDDRYEATNARGSEPFFGGPLEYVDDGAQGYGYGGVGLQVDLAGNDTYRFTVQSTAGRSIWAMAQGMGGAGGLGLSVDAGGNDTRTGEGLGITGGTDGFQGMYVQGTGFFGGLGALVDLGSGRDAYHGWSNSTTTD
ncbi:MAG: hypothetical protein LC663_03110 [Actinobacteria bacterium]|nr:hypothetical protein [Actinomycetota bacterium]